MEVAVEFADRFGPTDRAYVGGIPAWHVAVRAALDELTEQGLVSVARRRLSLSKAGESAADEAAARLAAEPAAAAEPPRGPPTTTSRRRGPACPAGSPG